MPQTSAITILAPRIVQGSPLPRGWKRRGEFRDTAGLDDGGLLARAFGLDTGNLPMAALHYLGATGVDPGGYCLFAYPVHLHARREQLILMAGPEFEPSEAEASELIELIGEYFPHWRIERTPDAMWFLIVDEDPDLETTALQDVIGEDIHEHLPRGSDAMRWQKTLTELQMVLFDCRVNDRREAAGQPPLNSLWFWSGGRLPDVRLPNCKRVVGNDPVAMGMGRRSGIETRWLEGTPAADELDIASAGTVWVQRPGAPDGAGEPLLSTGQWNVLREALRRGELDRLVLIEPGYGELTIESRRAGSWWPW